MTAALRSIVMTGGQGDVVMAANGLAALLRLGAPALAPEAVCYVRSLAAPLIAWMLPEVHVESISLSKHAPHPRYHTSANTSWSTVARNWFGADYYVNFASPRRRASFGFPIPGGVERMQNWLTERCLYASLDWRRASPVYYGQRMWTPLAARHGFSEIDLLRGLHQSYQDLRVRLRERAARTPLPAGAPPVAIFPVGKAYQTMPPAFVAALVEGLSAQDYACYLAPGDAIIERYRAAGLRCEVAPDLDAVLAVVAHSRVTATVDSFISHVAQLAAQRHVAFMSHDLPQHTLHPAALSQVVFTPMPCVPCNYLVRHDVQACAAGRPCCGVYEDPAYLARGRAALFGQESQG
ncbi:MAG: hypothetical protein HZB71_03480 [Betaproteobacteria bacterium]|nr:hypothetical protein [Betaproteobacteria bacterium]